MALIVLNRVMDPSVSDASYNINYQSTIIAIASISVFINFLQIYDTSIVK